MDRTTTEFINFEITKTIHMKRIFVIRHAKSSWEFPELEDIERPLILKGEKRTKKIIDYLLHKKVTPHLIISSPAVRAFETAKIIATGLGYDVDKIRQEKDIYFGDTESYFETLYQIDDELNDVFIVGHNPTITSFANYFLQQKTDYLPTSGVACIQFKTDKWSEISNCKWTEEFLITPKML